MNMNAITVSVEYDDLLAVTLPRMVECFDRVVVVTDLHDDATVLVANSYVNACTFQTDAFYRRDAAFNKGLALEEGFDYLGRSGWIAILDADILLPRKMESLELSPGNLYRPRRRMCRTLDTLEDVTLYDWSDYSINYEPEHAGYFQLFHADDPVIAAIRPWYGTTWRHAGGGDSDFQAHWPKGRRKMLPFEVLHLGCECKNWHGRCTPRLDGATIAKADDRREQHARMMAERIRQGKWGVDQEKLKR